MKTGKPLWRVFAESSRDKKETRQYHVIAPEMEVTPRGTRSNEWNVKEVCAEKGWNITSAMFLGMVHQTPTGTIDISNVPEKEVEDKPKKDFKKPFKKRK